MKRAWKIFWKRKFLWEKCITYLCTELKESFVFCVPLPPKLKGFRMLTPPFKKQRTRPPWTLPSDPPILTDCVWKGVLKIKTDLCQVLTSLSSFFANWSSYSLLHLIILGGKLSSTPMRWDSAGKKCWEIFMNAMNVL